MQLKAGLDVLAERKISSPYRKIETLKFSPQTTFTDWPRTTQKGFEKIKINYTPKEVWSYCCHKFVEYSFLLYDAVNSGRNVPTPGETCLSDFQGENKGGIIRQNATKFLPLYTVSHFRRRYSSRWLNPQCAVLPVKLIIAEITFYGRHRIMTVFTRAHRYENNT